MLTFLCSMLLYILLLTDLHSTVSCGSYVLTTVALHAEVLPFITVDEKNKHFNVWVVVTTLMRSTKHA